MAWGGVWFGLLVWLVVGCADSESQRPVEYRDGGDDDGGDGGGGRDDGGRDDGGGGGDDDGGLVVKCEERDEETCQDDDCRDVRAYLVGEPSGPPAFIICVEDNSCGDGDVVTCAINDETGQLAAFTTNCVPPGWTEMHGACDPDEDAGSR